MFTIALIARKGGSGKTTLGVHLALAAHLRGEHVLIADVDPQRSSVEALRPRQALGPRTVATTGLQLSGLQMDAVRQHCGLMLIDTAAGVAEDGAKAIVLADLSLIVVRPTYLDLAAAIESVMMVRRLHKPLLLVLNQAPPPRDGVEAPAVRRALKALSVLKQPVAPTIIRARQIYQSSLETGRTAEELAHPAAAQDIAELLAYIRHDVSEMRHRAAS